MSRTAHATLITSNPVSRAKLFALPTPKKTATYCPVSYRDFLTALERSFTAQGLVITNEKIGTSANGNQVFGTWNLDTPSGEDSIVSANGTSGLVCGWRKSHNKTLPIGVVTGSSVFVCENLELSGDADAVVRKHTKNVVEDMLRLFNLVATNARPNFARVTSEMARMQTIPMNDKQAYYLAADLYRNGVINRRLMGMLFETHMVSLDGGKKVSRRGLWNSPTHDEFGQNTLYAFYQALNEAIKVCQARDIATRQFGLHNGAVKWAEEQGIILVRKPVGEA